MTPQTPLAAAHPAIETPTDNPAETPATPLDTTVFHISQWKAGSAWVQSVLREAHPSLIIEPDADSSRGVFNQPIQKGHIYSPLYIHRDAFIRSAAGQTEHHRFVVIRDLRDILVSWHKSLAKSHGINPVVAMHREQLSKLSNEEGLAYCLTHRHFQGLAMVASTWARSDDLVVRYEDILDDQFGSFRRIFDHCQIPIADDRLATIVKCRSFEAVTGRARGQESATSHHRRGVAGDWKNHFTPDLTREFKSRYGHLLIITGYEPDADW